MWGELSWGEFSLGRVDLGRVVFGASCPDPVFKISTIRICYNILFSKSKSAKGDNSTN